MDQPQLPMMRCDVPVGLLDALYNYLIDRTPHTTMLAERLQDVRVVPPEQDAKQPG